MLILPTHKNASNTGYDPVWDDIYASGHEQKAPWDNVVSFVYRNKPKDAENNNVQILEVGCGTASNLRFFAKEGFAVAGLDAAKTAIQCAQDFFKDHGLKGDLKVGSFDDLPFDDGAFDLVIDRAALTHVGISVQERAINEVHRVLKSDGKFLYTPYADTHHSCVSGEEFEDGLVKNISAGTLQNVGHMCFMSQDKIDTLFPKEQWSIETMEYEERYDVLSDNKERHAGWRVIARKI